MFFFLFKSINTIVSDEIPEKGIRFFRRGKRTRSEDWAMLTPSLKFGSNKKTKQTKKGGTTKKFKEIKEKTSRIAFPRYRCLVEDDGFLKTNNEK